MSPGLKRILLIHTHIQGKIVELRLDGHTSFSGENGAGKTTLLKLIPFFYGAEPSRLFPHVASLNSFIDHFLPHDRSFIVFEYATEQGLRCVAVYRHVSGQKPAYRFIGKGFEQAMFLHDDDSQKKTVIKGKDLGGHLTRLNIPHARQIETVLEYRGVLLNQRDSLNESPHAKDLKPMVHLYSLSPAHKIFHLEKITESVLGRTNAVERIKQMMADIMTEEGVKITDHVINKRDAKVVDNLSALREFSNQVTKIEAVISDAVMLSNLRTELGEKAGQLKAWLGVLAESFVALNVEKEALASNKTEVVARWEVRHDELWKTRNNHRLGANSLEGKLNDIQGIWDAWMERDVYTKRARLSELDSLEGERIPAAEKRLSQLEDRAANAKSLFFQSKSEVQERTQKRLESLQGAIAKIDTDERALRDRESQESSRLRRESQEKRDHTRALFSKGIDDLRVRLGEARHRMRIIFRTEAEDLRLAEAEQVRHDRLQVKEGAEAALAQHRQLVNTAAEAFKAATEELRKCQVALDDENATLKKFMDWRKPETGSFLALLHEQDPNWHERIGRVLSPELLARKDLRPERFGDQDTLYGWSIRLDAIAKPDHAKDYDAHTQRIDDQDRIIANATARLVAAQNAHVLIEKKYHAGQMQLAQLDREQEDASNKSRAAHQNYLHVESEIRCAGERRKADAGTEAKAIERELKDVEAAMVAQLEGIKEAEAESIRELQGGLALDFEACRALRGETEKQITQAKADLKTACAALEKDYRQRLSEQGIDEATFDSARTELQQLRASAQEIRGFKNEVSDFDYFERGEWSKRADWSAQLIEEKEGFRVTDAAFENESTAHAKAIAAIKQEETSLQLRELRLNTDKSTTDRLLLCLGVPRPYTGRASDLPSLSLIDQDVSQGLDRARDLDERIIQGVTKAEAIITRRPNTPISEAWAQQCQAMPDKDCTASESALLKAGFLDRLMRDSLPQIRAAILQSVVALGLGLRNLYDSMSTVQTKVAHQSQLISKGIQDLTTFDTIAGIRLSLVSRIDRLDYWPLLRAVKEAYNEWPRGSDDELPNERLEEALASALAALLVSRDDRTINALFDIEIKVTENGREVRIVSDRDMENISSKGLTFLIHCTIYAGITRMLCRQANLNVHFPVDELGTLSSSNIGRLFSMLDASRIVMASGFPATTPGLLEHFKNRHIVQNGKGVVDMVVPDDALSLALKERNKQGIAHE